MTNSSQLKISPELTRLVQQAYAFEALTEIMREVLPLNLREQLISSIVQSNALICMVPSSSWATKLRYFEQDFLAATARELPHLGISQIKFRVVEPEPPVKTLPSKFNPPSKQVAEFMRETSKDLPPKLAASLIRLSQLADQDDQDN